MENELLFCFSQLAVKSNIIKNMIKYPIADILLHHSSVIHLKSALQDSKIKCVNDRKSERYINK